MVYTAQEIAALLQFSVRHVYDMEAEGRMPCRLPLGRMARWSKVTIDEWIVAGCPTVKEQQ
jgi:excisionase family DNA binding protein